MTADFSEEADHVLDLILAMPLAAAGDIALVSAASATQVDDALEELREKEWVESTTLGWLLKEPVERFYLTEEALEAMGLSSGTWHQPGALIRLLERAPAVEWFYPAASHFQSLGPVLDFQWVDDVGFDAVVEYQEGWIILLWIGLFRSESAVAERFERIGGDLCDLAVSDSLPRPGQVCCVVPDRFQVELVLRVVRRLHMEDWVSIWCISDDTWYGAEEVLPSGGLAYQWVYRRDGKPGSLEGALHRSQWSRTGNRTVTALLARVQPAVRDAVGDRHEAHRLMRDARRAVSKTDDPREASRMLEEFARSLAEQDANPGAAEILARVAASVRSPGIMADAAILLRAVAEWPGIPTTTASAILGENPRGRRAQRWLIRLADYGLVRRWRDGRDVRYRVTWKGMVILAKMDRTTAGRVWQRIRMDRWDNLDGFQIHEYGLLEVVEQFIAGGCPVFAGWREWDVLGHDGQVDPDAIVLVHRSPFGPGPSYLEYERSADRPSKTGGKLTGYDSPQRQNSWPVLFVCSTERMERHFSRIGQERGISLLTTTEKRIRAYGPLTNPLCWRRNGEPVELG